MVILLRKEISMDPNAIRSIPDMNVRDLFVLPYRMWSKYPPLHPPAPIQHPVAHVIASWTNTMECWSEEECVIGMWELQKSYRERGMDIPYNFVVGGDSNVYECRGWNAKPDKCDRHPDLEGVSIEIAHIGWKCEDDRDPYTGMCHQAWLLMEHGIKQGYLVEDLDFRPDYDPLHGTPWSEENKFDFSKLQEEEEEAMEMYRQGMGNKDIPLTEDAIDMRFV